MEASVAAAIATIIVGVVTLSVLLMQIKLYDKRRRRDYMSSMPQSPLDELKAVIDSTADALPRLAATGLGSGIQQISDTVIRFKHGAISFDGLQVPQPVVEEYARFAELIDELQGLAAQPNNHSGIASQHIQKILAGLEQHDSFLKAAQW